MKRKSLVIGLLVLALLLITSVSYAIWDTLTVDENITIPVGTPVVVEVELNPGETTGNLIPSGAIQGEGDVYEYVYTYNVVVTKLPAEDTLGLTVTAEALFGETNVDDAFNVAISYSPSQTLDTTTPVVVTVTITLKTDAAATTLYSTLQGKNVTIQLTFVAA